ncbi:MAG: PQQ-like beta-propeller repeat protein [Pirellulales bacterium]|nr:PQQ-like beta-propeller repeat protein [Pirellulales bacterium]
MFHRILLSLAALTFVLPHIGGRRSLHAQFLGPAPGGQFELAEGVQLDRVEGTALAQLERVKAFLADEKWDDAVETLRQLMEGTDEKLIALNEQRYVGLRDYCQLQLAALPPEALKLYRGRVDPLAEKWYREGVSRRDRRLLLKVVEQAFAGSWGDKALLALGDLSFESGDFAAARWYWERIIPHAPPPNSPTNIEQRQKSSNRDQWSRLYTAWPGYPDAKLDPASVRARLALASILEGDRSRAKDELLEFNRLHKEARGWLAGREVVFAEELAKLLAESDNWPTTAEKTDWPTFAGSPARNAIARLPVESGGVAWRLPLPIAASATRPFAADDPHAPLSYYPIFSGELALVNTSREIFAIRTATGKPAFGQSAAIYRDPLDRTAGEAALPALGVPRYTMTYRGGKVYAWMGSHLTNQPLVDASSMKPGYLVCLDLRAEGRLLWKISPEEGWMFDGAPLADDRGVYAAMRRNDIRPQAYVACFDPLTGRQRWRRFVAGAETPNRGVFGQYSHDLLTLFGDTLYFNTNLGAVASLSTDDGRIHWLSLYPRARRGDMERLAPHWSRDLNPCVYHRGVLYVAPADSPRIFALDAGNGQILWQSGAEIEDAVHLLGATDDYLIAGGWRLYWIDLKGQRAGRAVHFWPEGSEKLGLGRGILTDRLVVWPTRDKILLFDRRTAKPEKTIELGPRGVTGGNVFLAEGSMIIATGSELICLQPGKNKQESGEKREYAVGSRR